MGDIAALKTTPLFGVPFNNSAPTEAPAPTQPQRYVEQDRRHQGAAGVARDILGTLGDFLLTRLRMPAMYGPAQQTRRLAAAQEGIDTDPISAIQRVSSIDPVFGARLRDQYIDNQRQAAAQASTTEARDARLAATQALQDDRTRSRAAAMLSTMAGWDDNRRSSGYGALRDQIIRYGQAQGLDLSNELPTTFDANQLDSFIDGSVPVGTQRSQRLVRERMDQQQRQADQRDATIRRGQDIGSTDRRRGQDINSSDRAASRATTERGQDLANSSRQTSQREQSRHNRAMEARPGRFVPDPNRIYIQNGQRFRYNAQTRTYYRVN